MSLLRYPKVIPLKTLGSFVFELCCGQTNKQNAIHADRHSRAWIIMLSVVIFDITSSHCKVLFGSFNVRIFIVALAAVCMKVIEVTISAVL